MDVRQALQLLGGLSAAGFMRRHWQKAPLLVRQAMPGVVPPLSRRALFELAARDDVESRLVVRSTDGWSVRQGPLPRRSLPPLARREWTLLVQGVDLHVGPAHRMLSQFRFVPDARLDDLMISYASDGGGVGPHLDSYDVFLLQVQGQRRWSVGPVADASFVADAPLKILRRFEPRQEWLLDAGDMLYLPPGWGHDGVAVGECMTCSIGFRAASDVELAADVLSRLAGVEGDIAGRLYRDPTQAATATPAKVPANLQRFAVRAVANAMVRDGGVFMALGEALTEPKARVWFESGSPLRGDAALRLDARTRMLYDDRHLFVNGESYRIAGRDARLLRALADTRWLLPTQWRGLGPNARAQLDEWARAGWVHQKEHVDASS